MRMDEVEPESTEEEFLHETRMFPLGLACVLGDVARFDFRSEVVALCFGHVGHQWPPQVVRAARRGVGMLVWNREAGRRASRSVLDKYPSARVATIGGAADHSAGLVALNKDTPPITAIVANANHCSAYDRCGPASITGDSSRRGTESARATESDVITR